MKIEGVWKDEYFAHQKNKRFLVDAPLMLDGKEIGQIISAVAEDDEGTVRFTAEVSDEFADRLVVGNGPWTRVGP